MTTEVDTPVGGKIFPKESEVLPDGIRVQIKSVSGDWESGVIGTKDNAFFTNVALREKKVNMFKLALFDKSGNKIPVDPDSFTITQGMSIAEPPLIRSIGVELEDGSFSKHLNKGASLPARITIKYLTTHTVRPGENEDILKIHVWEGESEIANRNRLIGTLKITGDKIKRTLPENSEIEITISVDQSRTVSAEAFCPLLDQKFTGIIMDKISPKIKPEDIAQDLEGEEERLENLKQEIQHTGDKSVEQRLSEGRVDEGIDEIKGDIEAARGGDPDAVEKADRELKELRQKLDSVEYLSHWPVTLKECNEVIDDCEDIVGKHGNDDDKDQLTGLKNEAEKAINNKDVKRLKKVTEEIINIRWAVLFREPSFWIAAFQEIKSGPSRFTNQRRAEELIEEGSGALQRQDLDSLKTIMVELWSLMLMPTEEQEEISKRVSDAGIRKYDS